MISIADAHHPIPSPGVGHISIKLNRQGRAAIFCYENEVPAFVELELEKKYCNFFSTLTHLRESGRIENASTYVALNEGNISAIFLFQRHEGEVRVLNEVITVDEDAVLQFSNYIFSEYRSVGVVSFHAVRADICRLGLPYQRINCLEDIVLALPCVIEDYFTRLGKSTRKTIKGYSSKLKRDFPTFHSQTYEREEADEEHIRTIIELNRVRLLTSGKISSFDENAIKHIIRSVKAYGMTCVATINGKICAGSISYKVGKSYFMHVSGHDIAYDHYRLGTLYRYFTICECIRQGGRECHFLWGRQEYKFSFLGVQRDLHDLIVYRSRLQFFLHSDMVLQTIIKGSQRQMLLLARTWREHRSGLSTIGAKLLSKLRMARSRA